MRRPGGLARAGPARNRASEASYAVGVAAGKEML